MDDRIVQAMERFLEESREPATMGARATSQEARESRTNAALTRLLARRQQLVEGEGWRSVTPFVALIVLSGVGVAAAFWGPVSGAVGVAVAAAVATMFRLLQLNEQRKARNMVFALLQIAAKTGKYPPIELVELLLAASRSSATAEPAAPNERTKP